MKTPIAPLLLCALVCGCAVAPDRDSGFTTDRIVPVYPGEAAAAPGTIYREGGSLSLFTDLRARNVGDILTVQLVERTNASKESSTTTARSTDIDTGFPVIAGRPVTSSGTEFLNNEISADNAFSGQADASQSNSLSGAITVTVAERLPNGNLVVMGEKWITLNQGEELIRLTGIVRPVDIRPDNSIASVKLADARITYSGRGALADANRQGWLARFFNSRWMPF